MDWVGLAYLGIMMLYVICHGFYALGSDAGYRKCLKKVWADRDRTIRGVHGN